MLVTGTRLIVKDETEVLIPKILREEMMKILHFTHIGDAAMLRQTKKKIFFQNIMMNATSVRNTKTDSAQAHNEVSYGNTFSNVLPGQRLELDYAERRNQSYFLIVCTLTGFVRAYKTANKSTRKALKGLRAWAVS